MKLTWDPSIGRYRRENGHILTLKELRTALNSDFATLAGAVAELAHDAHEAKLRIELWREAMREFIKETHLTAAAVAKGGVSQLGFQDYGRVGSIVKEEYAFLDKWVQQVKDGSAKVTEGRAQQYINAGRETYYEIERRDVADRGFDEERSVLHPAEHCADCIAEARAGPGRDGWRPIGLMIPIGRRQCRHNCHCSVQYRKRSAA